MFVTVRSHKDSHLYSSEKGARGRVYLFSIRVRRILLMHRRDVRVKMRTIQMTLDEDLVEAVDNIVKKLKTTRSAFARKALKDAVRQAHVKNPAAETAGRQKLNICFQCHSRPMGRTPRVIDLSGRSDSQRRLASRILPIPKAFGKRFWTSQNDRNKELRQRPQGGKFIKSLINPVFQGHNACRAWYRQHSVLFSLLALYFLASR